MKKALSSMPFNKIAFYVFGILTLSLTGCFDKEDDTQEPVKISYVSFYHGSPDAPDLDILINSQKLNNLPFKYKDYSNFLPFNPGNVRVKFTPVNTSSNAYIDTALTFKENKVYSLFVVDKLQQIDILVLNDSLVAPAAGKAGVRILHLSPDAPTVDLVTTGTSGAPVVNGITFKSDSEFEELSAGTHSFQVKATGSGEVLLSVPNVDLAASSLYTFVLRGFVTPPTGNTNTFSMQTIKSF